jgi:hypothetical protein
MAADESEGFVRSVTPLAGENEDPQMNAIGWLLFAGMLIVILPLLPVLAVVWVIGKLTGR